MQPLAAARNARLHPSQPKRRLLWLVTSCLEPYSCLASPRHRQRRYTTTHRCANGPDVFTYIVCCPTAIPRKPHAIDTRPAPGAHPSNPIRASATQRPQCSSSTTPSRSTSPSHPLDHQRRLLRSQPAAHPPARRVQVQAPARDQLEHHGLRLRVQFHAQLLRAGD